MRIWLKIFLAARNNSYYGCIEYISFSPNNHEVESNDLIETFSEYHGCTSDTVREVSALTITIT